MTKSGEAMDKKSVCSFLGLGLIWRPAVPLMAAGMMILAADISAQVTKPVSGVIAASTSPVEIRFDGGGAVGRLAGTGDPVHLDDEVITGPETSAQILLKDQSLFSIGPSSVITIDRFVYDPDKDGTSSLVATITRGTFKFISGRIARSGDENMVLNLPNAVASIRGTSGAGRINTDGTTEIALLSGSISLNSGGAAPVDLLTSGWGVTISPTGGIGAPELIPAQDLDSLISGTEFIQSSPGGENQASDSGSGNGDVSRIILENQNLLNLTNIDPALLAPEESVGVNISTALLSYALAGGEPQWMTVINENGSPRVGTPAPRPDYAGLVSEIYAGAVRFDRTGLELPNAGDSAADTGMADYDITFDYDTLTFSGTYRIYDLVMGGRAYTDGSETSFTGALHTETNNAGERIYKYPQFDAAGSLAASGNQDENGNGLLDTGETLEGLTIARGTVSMDGSSDFEGHVSVGGHFGSISNGVSAIDGNFGGIFVAVDEVDTSGGTPAFTGNSVSGIQYEIGDVSQP